VHNLGMNDGLFFCLGLCCLRLTLVEQEDDEERGGDNLCLRSSRTATPSARALSCACPLISISMTKSAVLAFPYRDWKHLQRLK